MNFDPTEYVKQLEVARSFLQKELGPAPESALVLGSGLGVFLEQVDHEVEIPYHEVPGFPIPSVVGHAGRLTISCTGEKRYCALQGRVHWYEGFSMAEIVFSVRALALCGVNTFIITNAAGAINVEVEPGDLMLISDHINLLGDNPLVGVNLDVLGERFPDMTEAYDRALLELGRRCARELQMPIWQGVYAAVKGPSYETPAEIRMLRIIGADAVGMSTVPEVIALNHMRKRVMGISCITNMAAGVLSTRLDHRDVLETTQKVQEKFARLLLKVLSEHD
ncbi:MAG TPA: purine-nucleoside phosphorylase [Acidobacteriota bacterium]|nr:purine-nucleoside phosphorylase [Acidobacteriota bacterium]